MKTPIIFIIISSLILYSCGESNTTETKQVIPQQKTLQLFGFAVVDCGWDDPNDAEVKTNFVDEVSGFTNINQMCVYSPNEDIRNRAFAFDQAGMKAILYIEAIFFEQIVDQSTPSGMRALLLDDAFERWQAFILTNSEILSLEFIAALYIADEPVWNGMVKADFEYVLQLVKDSFPTIPTLSIEAYPVIDQVMIPANLDWVGFDRYDTAKPDSDLAWLEDLETLRNARTRLDQKIVIVASSQWLPYYETDANITPDDVASVVQSYYKIAVSDPDVIALVGYLWPGGLDDINQLGARNLPNNVQNILRDIGHTIIF